MSNPNPSVPETAVSRIQIDALVVEKITFALFVNGDKPVREVSVTNRGDAPLLSGRIVVRWQHEGSDVVEFPFGRLEPDATLTISPALSLPLANLASQTERDVTALVVRVESDAGQHERKFPVELVPFDYWPGTSAALEQLASFVTPNHERVAELLTIARPQLERLSGRSAFDGYQSKVRQRVVDIAHACGCAVQGLGVGYAEPPPSFEKLGQRVRFADRVLRDRLGSCLDLSLLMASMWECAGLRPVLVLVEGHAMCGFWTKPGLLAEPVHDDPAHIRNPKCLVFDLDPGEGVGFQAVVQAARRVREVLMEVKLVSFVRLSGGKGLHVVSPISPTATWQRAKNFAHTVARYLEKSEPRRYIASMSKAKRTGRIFVDYLRNAEGATAIASYSTRNRDGGPVAMPVSWEALDEFENAAAFSVLTALTFLRRRRKDPWAEFFTLSQTLPL